MIRIGIPVRFIDGRYVVNANYIEALVKAHAEPVIIVPQHDLESLILTLNGVLIPGGFDIDPKFYHEADLYCGPLHLETDKLDLALIKAALKSKLEIFGICRGQQVINVALGGTLIQDIPSQVETQLDHNTSQVHGTLTKGHLIQVLPNSRLASLCPSEIEVNSYHHQAIKNLADGLSVSALAEDGVIEAIEGHKIFAVQWHPERMILDPVFQGLFDDFISRCTL